MKNQFFDQKIFNNFETPMQKLMELNVKMMQNFSYIKPMDFLSVKKPEEMFEKQVELFVQNSHMILDYMRTTFSILENHWSNVSQNFEQSQKSMMNDTFSTLEKSTKKATTAAKGTAKKVTASVKKSASTAKKATTDATKAHTNKDTKVAKSTKTFDTKTEKKKAKSTETTPKKSNILQTKEPLTQSASTTTTDKNMPNSGKVTEKSSTQDFNIQKY